MKKLLLSFILLTLSAFLCAQESNKYGVGSMNFIDGGAFFSDIVLVEGVAADEIYSRAKLAIAEIFRSANDVIQLDDKQKGVMIIKGVNTNYTNQRYSNCTTYFMLKFQVKDGRYKAEVTNLSVTTTSNINGIISKNNYPADNLTDEVCLKKNGELKFFAPGSLRLCVIDTKDLIFATLKEKITRPLGGANTSDDW